MLLMQRKRNLEEYLMKNSKVKIREEQKLKNLDGLEEVFQYQF